MQGASQHCICDSFSAVGRWHQHSLVLAAALGVSGCLLFADPVNKAPAVKDISTKAAVIYRDQPVDFWATVSDDKDSPSALQLRWHEFEAGETKSCLWVTPNQWPTGIKTSPLDAPYSFKAESLKTMCLCAQVTDSNGASGYGCSLPIKPVALPPDITDDSGVASNIDRPLCSQVRLSAHNADYPTGSPVQFNWTIQYSGTDANGKSVQFVACDPAPTSKDVHRCFSASVPGTYTVSLEIVDNTDSSAPSKTMSEPFVIPVAKDVPPCIRRSDPGVNAQRILLSGDQSRAVSVLSADDDCEPYPGVAGSTGTTQFVWSVLDPTSGTTATWAPQTNTSPSFTVSQSQFPNARPGDTIKVRLEVRDTLVQSDYGTIKDYGNTICPDSTDICCGPGGCPSANACVRWTTWTVEF